MASSDLGGLAFVCAAAAAAMVYARLAAARLSPGFPRLAALLPVVLVVLPALPFALSSVLLRTMAAFFLVWLCGFKLLLLAAGARGPLHPSLPLARFVACAALPVRLRDDDDDKPSSPRSSSELLRLSSSFAAKAALLAALVSLRGSRARLPSYAVPAFDAAHVYLILELFLASAAAVARRGTLGAELEPPFDRPYLASSLRDFWGRRWNLAVPALLRPCVYRPVRARSGSAAAGVVAAFLVSGVMHEVMFYYITMRPGNGEVTAFFAIHGACTVAEGWWCARRPPRPVATALTLAFVMGTASWLFFAPVVRSGLDKVIVAECEAVVAFLEEAGRGLAAATARLFSPATS
ncbi:hypothetical protein QOZ80_4BG0345610 [Eleusine coracana subsp. coracana]|nr:hypothetical protein QOZ80_4BG0345610 [Eleusine coracana subsp. coracana]